MEGVEIVVENNDDEYQPFKLMSAWFSSSVQPDIINKWRKYGGNFETKEKADYLFSDNSFDKDTTQLYNTTSTAGLVIFKPNWIEDIIESKQGPSDVPIASYLLYPHYTFPTLTETQCTTPPQITRRPLILPRLGKVGSTISLRRLNEIEGLKNHHACMTREGIDDEQQVSCDFESKRKQGIVHIKSLGTICMRFIDLGKAQNIVIKKKR